MHSFSQTSKFEKKAFGKQNRRQRKGEIRNKAARKKRQPPTNKPEHSIKKSHKPRAPSSVKNTHSYQGLTLQIEKIHLERERAYDEYYYYMDSYYEEMSQSQQEREEEEEEELRIAFYEEKESKQKAKNQLEREVQKEKEKARLETIAKNNLEKIIITIGENFLGNKTEINFKNYKISIEPI